MLDPCPCVRSSHWVLIASKQTDCGLLEQAFGQFGIGPFDAHWFDRWIGRSAPSLGAQMVQDYEQITVDATELVARKEVCWTQHKLLRLVSNPSLTALGAGSFRENGSRSSWTSAACCV